MGGGAPRESGFEGHHWFDHKNSTGLGETNSTLGGCTQRLMCTREKSSNLIRDWVVLPASIGGSPVEAGTCGLLQGQKHWRQ